MTTKIGILSRVADTGGIQLDSKAFWINADNSVKKAILDGQIDLEKAKAMVGQRVDVEISDKGYWTGICLNPEEAGSSEAEDIEEAETPVPGQIVAKKTEKKRTGLQNIEESYFSKLATIELPTEKKGNKLTYVSWADCWKSLKQQHSNANYEIHLTQEETPLFKAGTGGMVKVSVKVSGVEHTVMLPVMDNYNKSINYDKIDSFDINKSIQRALVKATAMHGLGLYVFQGETSPEEE